MREGKKSSDFLLFASHLRSFAGGKHSFRFYSQLDRRKITHIFYIFFFSSKNVRKYFPHIYIFFIYFCDVVSIFSWDLNAKVNRRAFLTRCRREVKFLRELVNRKFVVEKQHQVHREKRAKVEKFDVVDSVRESAVMGYQSISNEIVEWVVIRMRKFIFSLGRSAARHKSFEIHLKSLNDAIINIVVQVQSSSAHTHPSLWIIH